MYGFVIAALGVFGGWLGAFVGSYMKRKGENLATHEDLDKLVKQMEATTNATKAIEARISNEVWDRQKHWELKRDALVAALQGLERSDVALMEMTIAFKNAVETGEHSESTQRFKREKVAAWNDAINGYDDRLVVANLVCSRVMTDSLRAAGKGIRSGASRLFKGMASDYSEMGRDVHRAMKEAFDLARRELGLSEN
jgi:adenosyl cobinamide kinase/adenosyl cobinamide phosphate guanylyltransferase